MARLKGKVAIVTGGGQGIGRGTVLAFAAEGARVAVVDVNAATAASTADEARGRGAEAVAVPCDVGVREQVDEAVRQTVEAFGTVDILVNCASATPRFAALEELTERDWERVWRAGPLGTFFFMQACFPYLRRHGGAVVNFGSGAGVDGQPFFGEYAAAKEAIRGVTRVAAREWGKLGIRVNTICPYAKSPGWEDWVDANPGMRESLEQATTLGRVGDPETDIGRAVLFLATDDSAYVTGHTLMVDGGSCRW